MPITDLELGWLVGILDGEGSVGLNNTGRSSIVAQVQMSTTCEATSLEVRRLLAALGITAIGNCYQEKQNHHRPSWHIRVARLGDVATLARLLGPHSICKRAQWKLAGQFCESRIANGAGVDAIGRQHARRRPYSEAEKAMQEQMMMLNRRGRRATAAH